MRRGLSFIAMLWLASATARAELLPELGRVQATADLAKSLDPIGDAHWRPPVPGAIRTSFGTQIHPHCMQLAKKDAPAVDDAALAASYDRWVSGATQLVAERCWNRYPG